MTFQLPEGLNSDLVAVAWMLGRWEGVGRSTYPGTEDTEFGQQVDFSDNGGDYLHYLSQTFELGPDGKALRPLSMETGFWRPQRDGSIEVLLAHPGGFVEIWYGKITGAKIELATDVVMRTNSAAEYTAGQRLYGNVEGDLLWTFDKAADGHELQTHQWARLQRAN